MKAKKLSDVDFNQWEIDILNETDLISTYVFSHIDNEKVRYAKYMVITFSDVDNFIESSSGSYDLCYITWNREMDSFLNPWIHLYSLWWDFWNNIYWEEYNNMDPHFEPCIDIMDPEKEILATMKANKRFKKENPFRISYIDTEKQEYSIWESTIKLNPTNNDLGRFYDYLQEILEDEKEL